MKLKCKDSYLYSDTEDKEEFTEYVKEEEKLWNSALKFRGYIFLNEILNALGFEMTRHGQFDGWVFDELYSGNKQTMKFKVKEENGELWLVLNEERNILDDVFKED